VARVLVTGATGFVGSNIATVLADRGHEVIAGTRGSGDLPWPALILEYADIQPSQLAGIDVVVHCAIANDFERLQADRSYARDSYVDLTSRLTRAAEAAGARMVFISTDWVFDGTGHLVTEDEPVNPVNFYGVLKAIGEQVIKDLATNGAICRIGGVKGWHRLAASAKRSQDVGFGYFTSTLVTQLSQGEPFTVWEGDNVNEVATVALASEIGAGIDRIIRREASGTFHLVCDEPVTRWDLAVRAADVFGLDRDLLRTGPVPAESQFPAPVPRDTSMDRSRTVATLGLAPAGVDDVLRALKAEMETGTVQPITPAQA
jgi:dTDP-4-dehydrorhamnose reductase